ncbi:MAG: rhodanese-like domain-containing protein [Anaerolineales bacterium]|nr:rhodanese-like domain-containing protein [Anaerolineales bacterium]
MKTGIVIFLTAIILTACQSKSVTGETIAVAGGSYQNITPRELNTILKDKDFVFVNVHIPFAGNISNTDLSISYDQVSIPENLAQLPTDKAAKIVLYCRSGRMSEIAATELVSRGYTNIWNLDGGMVAWEQAGYEIEK